MINRHVALRASFSSASSSMSMSSGCTTASLNQKKHSSHTNYLQNLKIQPSWASPPEKHHHLARKAITVEREHSLVFSNSTTGFTQVSQQQTVRKWTKSDQILQKKKNKSFAPLEGPPAPPKFSSWPLGFYLDSIVFLWMKKTAPPVEFGLETLVTGYAKSIPLIYWKRQTINMSHLPIDEWKKTRVKHHVHLIIYASCFYILQNLVKPIWFTSAPTVPQVMDLIWAAHLWKRTVLQQLPDGKRHKILFPRNSSSQ